VWFVNVHHKLVTEVDLCSAAGHIKITFFTNIMKEKKYSIVHVIDTLEAGGAERVLVTLCNIFFEHGHEVAVITTLDKGPLAAQLATGIELKELKRKSKWNLGDMKKLVAWCRPYDIVHVHSSHNLRYVFLAVKVFGLSKRIFFHEHFGNIDIDYSVSWHQKIVYPSVNLIAVSNSLYNWAIDKAKLDPKHVFVLPNTVPRLQTSKQFVEGNAVKQLVLVGNFRKAKNLLFAVDMMAVLTKKMQVQLTIIGQKNDAAYYQSVIEKIAALGLESNIKLLHECTEVQQLLHQFDMAIHTANTESGPLVLIEYMAQQIPFLTYDTGEVVQQVKNDLPLFVMNSFDLDSWVTRIEQILSHERRSYAEQLDRTFLKYYSEESYYHQCMEIYKKGLIKQNYVG
jgi:glycosyltransferase involved in cell wall biosynthesis